MSDPATVSDLHFMILALAIFNACLAFVIVVILKRLGEEDDE